VLTDTQVALIGDLLMLRYGEKDTQLWATLEDAAIPDAHRLAEAGWLDRRWNGNDLAYRASDVAIRAQTVHSLAVAAASTISQN
jgi:hypothetical protein